MLLTEITKEVTEAMGMVAFVSSAIACKAALAPESEQPLLLLLDDVQTLGLTEILNVIENKLTVASDGLLENISNESQATLEASPPRDCDR